MLSKTENNYMLILNNNKKMKKITMLFIALLSYVVNAQNDNSNIQRKNIQLGLSYSPASDYIIHKKPFNASINYQVKKWSAIDLGLGAQVYMFPPKSEYRKNFSARWGINPNVNSSYSFLNNKLRTYLAFGYYFGNYKLTTDEIPFLTPSREYTLKSNGFTVAPGIKYFFNSNIFLDINYTFLNVKTKDDQGFLHSSDNNLFNLGFGVSF